MVHFLDRQMMFEGPVNHGSCHSRAGGAGTY